MRAQGSYETGAYSGNPVKRSHRTKRSMSIPVCDDCLGEGETHPGEAGQVGGRSSVGIETLTWTERPGLLHSAIALRCGRARWQQREQLDLSGRVTRAGNQIPDTLARHGEGDEQEHGSAFGTEHWIRVLRYVRTAVSGILRGGPVLLLSPLFPPDQGHGDVAHDLKAGCADFVDRVIGRMPGGIIE